MHSSIVLTAVTLILAASANASAQEATAPVPIALSDAMRTLPDQTRYRIELAPGGLSASQQQTLLRMVGDAARGQHFYGAIYGYRPVAARTTQYSMRSKLHSRDAARRGALADCEAQRSQDDGPCALVGEILPENWSPDMPQLNHLAVEAVRASAEILPGNVAVARSRDGDFVEIRSGDDVRDETLAACNAANAAEGLPEDCELVIADPTAD